MAATHTGRGGAWKHFCPPRRGLTENNWESLICTKEKLLDWTKEKTVKSQTVWKVTHFDDNRERGGFCFPVKGANSHLSVSERMKGRSQTTKRCWFQIWVWHLSLQLFSLRNRERCIKGFLFFFCLQCRVCFSHCSSQRIKEHIFLISWKPKKNRTHVNEIWHFVYTHKKVSYITFCGLTGFLWY